MFGEWAQVLSPFIALLVAFATAPVIAWATRGRYYLAREPEQGLPHGAAEIQCSICENAFDRRDVALCPAYSGPICSLCCTLEARCRDMCKTNSRFTDQLRDLLGRVLPGRIATRLNTRGGQFVGLMFVFNAAIGLLLAIVHHQFAKGDIARSDMIEPVLWVVFWSLFVMSGVAAWLIVLAHESRRAAENESARQTTMLMDEIEAHKRTDAALQKAKEVAEAANVAKTRYIVGVSHEIRTPLNSIFGYAQLLERGIVGSTDNAIRVIRRSAEHMGNLIDGLLDISKIENGLLRLNRDRVHLVEFLDQIVDMFRLQAAAKGIEFRYQRPQHLPAFVHTDQKRLRQVLINLLSNAIKYTESGHASLVVRYRSQVAEFEITDSGIGIPPNDLERIFEPFERGNTPNVRAIPGTGLGLTITKLLTQIMGGEILARSTPGEGTTFTVKLLLSEVAHVTRAVMPRRITGYAGRPLKILLIDDDPHHLDIVQNLLRPLGFIVFSAKSGHGGLALASECIPDVAMIDLSMPDLTGWETAKQLRATAATERNSRRHRVRERARIHTWRRGRGARCIRHQADRNGIVARLRRVAVRLGMAYEEPAPLITATDPVGILPNHSRHHIDDLYQLGRIGHVRGIQAKLQEIEAEDPSNTPFAKHLRQLVANFDLKRYMNVLEAMRKNG